MDNFVVERNDEGSISVLKLSGKLDHHTAPGFKTAFAALCEERRYRIIVELSQLQYISSAGLNVLMQFIDEIRQHEGDIKITNALPSVYRIFDLVGYTHLYEFYDRKEEALKAFLNSGEDRL